MFFLNTWCVSFVEGPFLLAVPAGRCGFAACRGQLRPTGRYGSAWAPAAAGDAARGGGMVAKAGGPATLAVGAAEMDLGSCGFKKKRGEFFFVWGGVWYVGDVKLVLFGNAVREASEGFHW